MNQPDDPCPLVAYFAKSEETRTAFLERTGVKSTTLFELMRGQNKDYGIRNLFRIEAGTGGEITVRQLVEWLERINTPKEPA